MIEVAVIGAGSAGLVTAKHLLASGLRCCVFEAASSLGGAWSLPSEVVLAEGAEMITTNTKTKTSPMWRGLRTNLSKHTCRFSDFPWPEDTPTFPSKEDMDWYLKAYANEYILDEEENKDGGDPSKCSFLYDCRVTKISPIEAKSTLSSGDGGYRVEWTDSVAQTQHSKEFGGVVLATGFFSKPKYPTGLLQELEKRSHQHRDDAENLGGNDRMEILHSRDYACHEQFATAATAAASNASGGDDDASQTQKIAVVGSSHSALEIAVDLTKSVDHPVTVIMSRIPWVVPRYVPASTTEGSGFLPIDLALYKRTEPRDPSPTPAAAAAKETTALTPESCRSKNEYLRNLLGPRQDRILPVPGSSFDRPPMVAISDLFLDLVADGRIQVRRGRLTGLTDDGRGLFITKTKENGGEGEEEEISGITSLICCTGYSPDLESCCGASTLNPVLDTIQYDSADTFSPMTTYLETLHPQLPNLAFVGMYRGPYIGVVELQARLASEHLSGKANAKLSEEDFRMGLETSDAIRKQDPLLRPQFPRFDYVGFMDSLAGSLSSSEPCFPIGNRSAGDMVTPAFYQPDAALVEAARADLEKEVNRGKSGNHLPGIVTSALVGNWSFERDIVHFSNGGRTIAQRQYIHGKVNYSRSRDHRSIRYREDGFFEVAPGKSLPVFREYDYLCTGGDENDIGGGTTLELFFVEGGKRTYLFLSLRFQYQDSDGYWVATSDHLCIKDLYTAKFRIKLDGLAATEVIITYRVKGPAKDYESTTVMRPRW